jgi:hypothetical protein
MLRRLLLCLLAFGVAGCGVIDPYKREGTWRPNNSNEDNLRAMVAVPSDLVRGVSGSEGTGQQAAAALDRLRNDKVRKLPDSGLAQVTPVSTGSGSQGGQ